MPKASPNTLILVAGIVWSGSGFFLVSLTASWFNQIDFFTLGFLLIAGAIIGLAKSKLVFSKYSEKNINRIMSYEKEKLCFWAFMPWPSYLIIGLMSGGGSVLRKSGLIPKEVLLPLYFGIGIALLASSLKYFAFLRRQRNQ